MKTIVYFADGSIESTACHAAIVSRGEARYATPEECASYERQFAEDDSRICRWCEEPISDCTLNECPERTP